MAEGAEPVEQHGAELDQDDGEEKEDQDDANGLQMQVLLGNDDLKKIQKISILEADDSEYRCTCSSSVMVMFSLTPKGQSICRVSLCRVSMNTIKTKRALKILKKKTALFRSSVNPCLT